VPGRGGGHSLQRRLVNDLDVTFMDRRNLGQKIACFSVNVKDRKAGKDYEAIALQKTAPIPLIALFKYFISKSLKYLSEKISAQMWHNTPLV
jgi:hypothetical protein